MRGKKRSTKTHSNKSDSAATSERPEASTPTNRIIRCFQLRYKFDVIRSRDRNRDQIGLAVISVHTEVHISAYSLSKCSYVLRVA